jgi:hypothetical protein
MVPQLFLSFFGNPNMNLGHFRRQSKKPGADSHELLNLDENASRRGLDGKASGVAPVELYNRNRNDSLWVPLILKASSLVAFLVSFLSIVISLPILYSFSRHNQGLGFTQPRFYYIWTYLPTALFSVLAVFWNRVEYRSKQLAPWLSMRKGGAPASHTVLLDYVSGSKIAVIPQALRNAHFLVVLTVTGSLLISLVIILSTSLFSMQEVVKDVLIPVNMLQAFNNTGILEHSAFNALQISHGLRSGSVSYPFGTTQNHVFPNFQLSGPSASSFNRSNTVTAEVDIFTFDLMCEEPEVILISENSTFTFRTDTCHPTVSFGYLTTDEDESVNTSFEFRPCTCNNTGGALNLLDPRSFSQLCGIVGKRGPNGTMNIAGSARNATTGIGGNQTLHYTNFTGLFCTPVYNMSRGSVSFKGDPSVPDSVSNLTVSPGVHTWTLNGTSSADVMHYISSIASASDALQLDDPDLANNYTFMESEVHKYYTTLAVQIAKQTLLQTSNAVTSGVVRGPQHRLVVRGLSFALIEAISVALICIITSIICLSPFGACSRDPGSVGGLATILIRSRGFVNSLTRLGTASNLHLKEALSELSYHTVMDDAEHSGSQTFCITQTTRSRHQAPIPRVTRHHKDEPTSPSTLSENILEEFPIEWWQPVFARMTARVLVVIFPIAMIVALEVLYRNSSSSDGFVTVTSTNAYIHEAWVYVPALFMFSVGVLINSAASVIQLFHPYSTLRNGGSSASDTILDNQLGITAIQCLWRALSRRKVAMAAASLATMLTPFLTIAVSGLYTLEYINYNVTSGVSQLNVWSLYHDTDLHYVKDDGVAALQVY